METRLSPNSEERTLKDLTPNVAALLCYVAGWISGIVFLVLEQKNRFVRFHALQSIIVFGTLTLAGSILGNIPEAGPFFSWSITALGFALWLLLMIKANAGEVFKLPWAGDLAEKLTVESMRQTTAQPANMPETPMTANTVEPLSPSTPQTARKETFRSKYYSFGAMTARRVGSAFAIAWSGVLLVFFNFYNQYLAYYEHVSVGGSTQWQRYTLITGDFNAWLPILNTTLALSIIGHALMITFDKYILNQITRIVLDVFGLATVAALLAIYPFNFDVIPNPDAVIGAQIGVTVTLVMIAVGFGIAALVRFIQLMVNVARGEY